MNKRTVLALLLVIFCLCGCEVQRIDAEAKLTEAEANLTEAETNLTEAETDQIEAETSQESQKALSEVVKELLAELRTERERSDRLQREQVQVLTGLVEELSRPRYTWLWVVAGVGVIGVIVAVLFLRRRERIVIMLPPNQAQPWLPVGESAIAPYQTQDTIQVVDLGQEIVIE